MSYIWFWLSKQIAELLFVLGIFATIGLIVLMGVLVIKFSEWINKGEKEKN